MRLLKLRQAATYVDGLRLLALCQKLVRETPSATPAGAGTSADPYVARTAAQWVWCWRNSPGDQLMYFKITGRLILKNARLYVGDNGPAYLKGTGRDDSAAKAAEVFLRDTVRTPGSGPLRNIPVAKRQPSPDRRLEATQHEP